MSLPLKKAAFRPFGHLDVKGVPDMAKDDLADVVATSKPKQGTAEMLLNANAGSVVLT